MVIAVDVGNSSTNIGYFVGQGCLVQKIDTVPPKTVPDYTGSIEKYFSENHLEKDGLGVIISSVVTGRAEQFLSAFGALTSGRDADIVIASHRMDSGLKLRLPRPEELGTDRLSDAVGAFALYGAPVVVIDCGTATTVSVVDGEGSFIGGAILPGLGLMNAALDAGTSKLKSIALNAPDFALGKDPGECIASGLFYGTAGALERIVSEIEKETGLSFRLITTGGYGKVLGRFIKRPHRYDPLLTLEGLRILYERNCPS